MKRKEIFFKSFVLSAIIAAFCTGLTAFALPEKATEHITEIIPAKIERIAQAATPEPIPETESDTEPAAETEQEAAKPETVEELIAEYCAAYGIDYNLALAIARLETGHFTSAAYLNGNNVGGLSVNEIPLKYATREEGVQAFVENLKSYYAAGLTTPETIGAVYCPANPDWAAVVRQLMQ